MSDDKPIVNRRKALEELGFVSFAAFLMKACGTDKFNGQGNLSFAISQPDPTPTETVAEPEPQVTPTEVPEVEPTPTENPLTPTPTPEPPCDTATTTTISVTQKAATGDLIPKVILYGSAQSGLLALQFTTTKEIRQVIVARSNGKLLAVRGVTAADRAANATSYRPMIFDNLILNLATQLKVVIDIGTDIYVYDAAVSYARTFQGLPVVDLGAQTVPANFTANQSVAQFLETSGSFGLDTNLVYPNDFNPNSTRNLQTVRSTSTWTPLAGVKGTVTDIMGNTIALAGGTLIEHQNICTYVTVGATVYRTMLRVG